MAKCPICGKGFMYSFAKANDGTQVCGDSCKTEYNKIKLANGNTGNNSNQSQSGNEEAKANAEQAKAQAAEAKSQENASCPNNLNSFVTA